MDYKQSARREATRFVESRISYRLCCKTEKFEAILYPCCSRRRCLRTADRHAPVPNGLSRGVIARAAFLRQGRHPSLLSHLDVVLPPPVTRLMYASRCRRRRHRHCLCRARWRIDRTPYHAHPRRRAGDHCITYFP
jgi:hypothetical protein